LTTTWFSYIFAPMENELFPRKKNPNHISSLDYHKTTIDIPVDIYSKVLADCMKQHPPKCVKDWVIEAIAWRFNTHFTTKQLIDFEIGRRLASFEAEDLPPKVIPTGSVRPEANPMHRYPGFVAGLLKDSFRFNKFRREVENRGQ
jgi:hypothetical protein